MSVASDRLLRAASGGYGIISIRLDAATNADDSSGSPEV
jgi:hypothetical protein